MRILLRFLVAAATVGPFTSQAQDDFAAGTYELADGTKGKGQLDYRFGPHPKLVVKDEAADPTSKAGKKGVAYSPEEVRAFDIGTAHYVVLPNIKLGTGIPMAATGTHRADFAKVLETGKLELFMYQLVVGRMGNFGNPTTSSRQAMAFYVLRRPGDDYATVLPIMGKKYQEVVANYLAGRPDLIKQAGTKPSLTVDFRTLVQQYNTAP